MRKEPRRGGWTAALNVIHGRPEGAVASSCTGRIYHYVYRFHPPGDSSYERCISMAWCTVCREACGGVVFVSRDTVLWDALAGLPEDERERLIRSSLGLRDHLDGIVRAGLWPEQSLTQAPAPRARPDRGRRRRR